MSIIKVKTKSTNKTSKSCLIGKYLSHLQILTIDKFYLAQFNEIYKLFLLILLIFIGFIVLYLNKCKYYNL